MKSRILVIKLGALGDFTQATGAFADIRAAHPKAHITLLTTLPFLSLAQRLPWFDHVRVDARRPFWDLRYVMTLRQHLSGFDMVYDLQTNDRSGIYFYLAGMPNWSGIAWGCSHPHANTQRNHMHTLDRLADQLKMANIAATHAPDITAARQSAEGLLKANNLTNYTLFVPGGAPHRPGKRWPHFKALGQEMRKLNHKIVLVGTTAEKPLLDDLAHALDAVNLCGKTTIGELIDLTNRADFVIGNDTGPMHIAAASGAKGVVLFGPESNPALCAPRAPGIHILCEDSLAAISPQTVLSTLGIS